MGSAHRIAARRGPARLLAGLAVAVGAAAALAPSAGAVSAPRPVTGRLLVVAATADEIDLRSFTAALDRIGIPYDTLIATGRRLTAAMLETRGVGSYQGIVLTTNDLLHRPPGSTRWVSAFDAREWQTLWRYERRYRVRQATLYAFPSARPEDPGLRPGAPAYVDVRATPLQLRLTPAGRRVFPYLQPTARIPVREARVYLARKADPSATPLLTTASGDVVAATRRQPDGRETLVVTAQSSPASLHGKLLSYGIVDWVTRGVFVGWRKVTFDAQIDDLFAATAMWKPGPRGSSVDRNATAGSFRTSGADLEALARWQARLRRSSPLLRSIALEWAFNGYGAKDGDDLTEAALRHLRTFNYVNHTFNHLSFDGLGYDVARYQITRNLEAGDDLGLVNWTRDTLVQPSISGLSNLDFFRAAHDAGVRYLISDTSVPAWSNPSPNAGFTVESQPSILVIPRHATDLFYDVRTPEQWVDQYNAIYWKGSPSASTSKFFETRRTYAQILDRESDKLLVHLVDWDVDPIMFHQANAGTYDGRRSLLSDLLDSTFAKYRALYRLPVQNLTMKQVGVRVADRMAFDRSGVLAVITPCRSIALSVRRAAPVPLTGVAAGRSETYGGETLSTVRVTPSTPRLIPLRCQ